MSRVLLAVQLNLVSFGIVAILLTVLLIVAGCRYCGYEFEPIRLSR